MAQHVNAIPRHAIVMARHAIAMTQHAIVITQHAIVIEKHRMIMAQHSNVIDDNSMLMNCNASACPTKGLRLLNLLQPLQKNCVCFTHLQLNGDRPQLDIKQVKTSEIQHGEEGKQVRETSHEPSFLLSLDFEKQVDKVNRDIEESWDAPLMNIRVVFSGMTSE